ncbi:hypothetical protein [Jongsikchunia kroppenstedtii]|uniref:hypothetical protein n=1 Tax=Jongsikchunia kroppenstedtii TaxID=1121721 RepID=UPI00037147C1|nr:hypothetical protein [Jongsikchunia kroppenstedtii]
MSDADDGGDAVSLRRERADHLKESLYLTFTALALSVALSYHGGISASAAITTLAITVLGAVLAMFTADLVSHMVVHERIMTRAETRHLVMSSFGALPAVALPFIFLIIAATTGWSVTTALTVSAIALTVALVLIAHLAVRSVELRWWQRVIVLAIEGALGLGVISLQVLAHS